MPDFTPFPMHSKIRMRAPGSKNAISPELPERALQAGKQGMSVADGSRVRVVTPKSVLAAGNHSRHPVSRKTQS